MFRPKVQYPEVRQGSNETSCTLKSKLIRSDCIPSLFDKGNLQKHKYLAHTVACLYARARAQERYLSSVVFTKAEHIVKLIDTLHSSWLLSRSI